MIKDNPELLDSCSSEKSELVELETIKSVVSNIKEQCQTFIDDAQGKINLEPPSRVLATIKDKLKIHEDAFQKFLNRKTALQSFHLLWSY